MYNKSSNPLPLVLIIFIIVISGFIPQELPTIRQKAVLATASSKLNEIQQENQRSGTKNWLLTHYTPLDGRNFTHDLGIEGYSSETSAIAGDSVGISVSTPAQSFNADLYRLGWYNGAGARLMKTIEHIKGSSYPIPSPDPQTGLVEAGWPVAFTITINPTWVSGLYIMKLTDSNLTQSYVSFVVRSTKKSTFAFIHTVNTDEAYNQWGGVSLYVDRTRRLPAKRAFKVSFDRPFLQNGGTGYILSWEYQMIRWLEKNSYDVSYFSDVDIQHTPNALLNYRGILLAGHSEYWSKEMRDNLEAAVSSGVNLAAFGANDIYWHIRYEPSSSSAVDRVIVCYKNKSLDPLYGKDNSQVTTTFRRDPVNRPEQSLLGSMYESYFDENIESNVPWIVSDATSWVFAGTKLKSGDGLPGLVGYEYDRVFAEYPKPLGVDILATSPIVNVYGNRSIANATLYTAPGGARVFNAGTIQWSWGLDGFSLLKNPLKVVNSAAQQITHNILQNFINVSSTPHS